jgi:hypothetical protein
VRSIPQRRPLDPGVCQGEDPSAPVETRGASMARRIDDDLVKIVRSIISSTSTVRPSVVDPNPGGKPWANTGNHEHTQDQPERHARRHRPLAKPRSVHLTSGPRKPVSGRQLCRVEEMTQHMQGHRSEPHDERRLVEQEHLTTYRHWSEKQHDPGGKHRHCQHDHDRAEKSQCKWWWSLPTIFGSSEVVTTKSPERATHLQQDWRHKQHPDEHVRGQE